MTVVASSEFAAFFEAIHGHAPFPWQRRLLEQILATGVWPDVLDLPTSSGKTSVLDIAVFALACDARMPRRIALVVDRRIVVDGAFERACKIAEAVANPREDVTRRVARALADRGGDEAAPLHAALLRGGIYREDRWARTPTQPTILCSTVDQVGSRLLHRGYGVSPRSWSLHAGLLGNDALLVLDEAHCSVPFRDTLRNVARYREQAEVSVGRRLAVVEMTATPDGDARGVFRLDADDRSNATLAKRLDAMKSMELEIAEDDGKLVALLADRAKGAAHAGNTVLVVVNRVATARAVQTTLAGKAKQRGKDAWDADVILLTGRVRPLERDALIDSRRDRLLSGRDRTATEGQRPLVVVATQCVEVGADLDVDALITEACPLDALRQRLGRLDRLGELSANGAPASAAVIAVKKQAWDGEGEAPDDPIYGSAIGHTWNWLQNQRKAGALDGGPVALGALASSADPRCSSPTQSAPILFPQYLDLWVQTGPEPAHSPQPALFLHGPGREEPDVQIVWRADLAEVPELWADTVALCPPVTAEAMSLRISVARRWLAGNTDKLPDDADLEGAGAIDTERLETINPIPFLLWRGEDRSCISEDPADIRPGDTIVVPATRGGCDAFGWNPESASPVRDVALEARQAARRAPVLRLHAALFTAETDDGARGVLAACNSTEPDEGDSRGDIDEVRALLRAWPSSLTGVALDAAATLAGDKRAVVRRPPSGRGWVVIGRALWAEHAADFTDEDDSSSRAPEPLTLTRHLADVRGQATEFASTLGLTAELAGDLALAGKLHDVGKADPRFQAWLHGGDRLRAAGGELLAKSVGLPVSAADRDRARKRAGYPAGGRHELLSVRLAESAEGTWRPHARDWELVLHLVASHHGHCRPFAPLIIDERPLDVGFELEGASMSASSDTRLEHLGSGVAERFWSLVRKYGWWGLSYLEACLRLADHRASESAMERREASDDRSA